MNRHPLAGDDRLTTATVDGARWLDRLQLWRPTGHDSLTTGAHETAVILLSGTFDLIGGTTSWPARGARLSPFAGRPMAVYLPPQTPFTVTPDPERGPHELLLISARQPTPTEPATQHQALSEKPLLPLAGSGKAFDPSTGEWKPEETFATAAESLPPRRFRRLPIGDLLVERVFAPDYKAATLSLDEVVVPPGTSLTLGDVPELPDCDETLLFVRTQHDAEVRTSTPDKLRSTTITATDHPTYLAIAYAGKR